MTTTEPNTETGVAVTLNGAEIIANKGELLIDAAERHGVYIPRFCYHPRMKPVGMCRMCLVEVDTGRGPALQPSCMLNVSDGMVVDTESDTTKKAQDGILEFLLINHPLDCPVCDKGGECPLQDQTIAFGPGESRFVEEKRHFEKPIPISDVVYLDRERCILCDRCTRFASDVAGDPLIHFQSRGNQTEVNTFPDEPFSSYFSGNTVQICPVGALTAKPYRFKARPWDLTETASTAVTDSVGARITVQSSRNEVLRYLGVDSDPVNWGWLSDKERFSFEALNSDARVTTPLVRGDSLGSASADGDQLVEASWSKALGMISTALEGVDASRVAVLGGARLTNEAQYAWAKLAKSVIGTDHVDTQMDDGLSPESLIDLPKATIDDVCAPGGTIVVVGVDPKETHGSLFLRLRHAVEHDGATLIEINERSSGLTPYAAHSLVATPGSVDAVAAAVAGADSVDGLGDLDAATVRAAAAAFAAADSTTVVLGSGSLASKGHMYDRAGAILAVAGAAVLPLPHRGNTMGAIDAGLAPGVLPGARLDTAKPAGWDKVPSFTSTGTRDIVAAAGAGAIDVLFVIGADPRTDIPDNEAAKALQNIGMVIAVETHLNATSLAADVVLPAAAAAAEVDGSFTNIEGRLSPVARKVTPQGTARPDWMIAVEIAAALGHDMEFIDLDELWDDYAMASPLHSNVNMAAIAESGTSGLMLDRASAGVAVGMEGQGAASGLSLISTRTMYDAGTTLAHCPSLAGLARTTVAAMHPATLSSHGLSDGDSVIVRSDRGSLTLPCVADEGVPTSGVSIAFNQSDVSAALLIDSRRAVTAVTVEAAS